jgi:hypothetical protein
MAGRKSSWVIAKTVGAAGTGAAGPGTGAGAGTGTGAGTGAAEMHRPRSSGARQH